MVTLKRLAKYGFESIEISGEPEQYDTTDLRRLLSETGMRCWGSVTLMLGERNLLAKDEAQRAKSDADFISKMEGGLQELDETAYW